MFCVFSSTTPAVGHNILASLFYESSLHVDEEMKMYFVFSAKMYFVFSASASSPTSLI